MVRTSFLNEITNTVSATGFFDITDFEVTTKEENGFYKLTIQYKYDNRFWYVGWIPIDTSSDKKMSATMIPGELNWRESHSLYGKSSLSSSINAWVGRLKEELLAIPVYRQVDEQRQSLEEMLKRLQDVEDVSFTREEAEELKAELDKLREQMIEHIKASAENQATQNQKIQSVTNDVDALKSSVDALSKPNWARAALSRFYKWGKDPENRKLIKDGVEVTAKLLSGNVEGK